MNFPDHEEHARIIAAVGGVEVQAAMDKCQLIDSMKDGVRREVAATELS